MKLKWYEWIILFVFFMILYFYTVIQKNFIPTVCLRTIALSSLSIIMLAVFFFIVKPVEPLKLGLFLSILLGTITGIIIVIQHVIIKFDISYKAIIIMSIALAVPYIISLIYIGISGILSRIKKGGK